MAYRRTENVNRRLAARRQVMVDAAADLFCADGLAGTTMKQVAVASETSIGSLYHYFADKDALFLAVVDEAVSGILAEINDARDGFQVPAARLAVGLAAQILGMFERPERARLLLSGGGDARLRGLVLARFTDDLRVFFDASPEAAGALPSDSAAHALQGAAFNLVERRLAGELRMPEPGLALLGARFSLGSLGHPPQTINRAMDDVAVLLHRRYEARP